MLEKKVLKPGAIREHTTPFMALLLIYIKLIQRVREGKVSRRDSKSVRKKPEINSVIVPFSDVSGQFLKKLFTLPRNKRECVIFLCAI
jgi:hypothetical protein